MASVVAGFGNGVSTAREAEVRRVPVKVPPDANVEPRAGVEDDEDREEPLGAALPEEVLPPNTVLS